MSLPYTNLYDRTMSSYWFDAKFFNQLCELFNRDCIVFTQNMTVSWSLTLLYIFSSILTLPHLCKETKKWLNSHFTFT